MSNFTTQLRFICETAAGLNESKGYSQVNSIIEDARTGIFDFSYPIFDENYRAVLEKKILKHYYTREICAETVGRWKLFLEVRMNEIMPYYNKLYSSELLQFNPLYDVDYTKSGNREKEGTEEGTENRDRTSGERMTGTVTDDLTGTTSDAVTGTVGDSGSNSSTRTDNLTKTSRDSGTDTDSSTSAEKNDRWDYYSDTPQGSVVNLANNTYLTNARHITDDGTGSTASNTKTYGKVTTDTDTGTVQNSGTDSNTRTYNTLDTTTHNTENEREYNTNKAGTLADDVERSNTINSTEEYLERVYGKTPGRTYAELLKQYRETFLNIDMMVINNLSDLFFGLYE